MYHELLEYVSLVLAQDQGYLSHELRNVISPFNRKSVALLRQHNTMTFPTSICTKTRST